MSQKPKALSPVHTIGIQILISPLKNELQITIVTIKKRYGVNTLSIFIIAKLNESFI
jgi:hypothetical protein